MLATIQKLLCAVVTSLLIVQPPLATYGETSKCETCRLLSRQFKEGLDKTAKSNFGGGNTNWEEQKLGSFASSETRFLEVLEQVCSDGSRECHHMVEEQEELLEQWFFLHYAPGIDLDLDVFLCIEKLRVCCPEGTYGATCTECPGGKDRPCSGNGRCVGSGTREGTGTCSCNGGYTGVLCTDCAAGYFEESRNETHTVCLACDRACNNSCSGPSRMNCHGCRSGWTEDEAEGCRDVDECQGEVNPCSDNEYCSNNDGSYVCPRCDMACVGCTSAGPDNCKACNARYFLEDSVCKKCHASCATTCTDATPTSCDSCINGWRQADDGRTCIDIDECSEGTRTCDPQFYCINTEGSSHCAACHAACDGCTGPSPSECRRCRSGFAATADSSECLDVDECVGTSVPCLLPAEQCVNTVGSFRCDCAAGFQRRSGKCEPKKKPVGKKKAKRKDPKPDFSSSPLTKDLGEPIEGQPIKTKEEMIVMEGSLKESQVAEASAAKESTGDGHHGELLRDDL